MRSRIGLVLVLMCVTASAQEFGPWSAPQSLGAGINTSSDDMHPTLSKDGLALIFSSNRPGGAGGLDLWVARRDSADDPWGDPENLTMLNTPFDDHAPNLTSNGHWLFFYSTRPGGCNEGGRTELWAVHRQDKRDDTGWEEPFNLGCALNIAGADEGAPSFWADDSTSTLYLYFARNLTPANGNGLDIFVSTCTSDIDSCNRQQLWSPATYVTELNSPLRDTRTTISRDGLEMIVTSNRAGTVGGLDLWVTTRPSAQDSWSVPIDLNAQNQEKCFASGIEPGSCPAVNGTTNDGAAALSWDGRTMIFYSNRAGGFGGNDLYVSTREKLTGASGGSFTGY